MRFSRWLCIGTAVAAVVTATSCARSRNRLPDSRDWPQGYSADVSYNDVKNPANSYHGKLFVNALAEPRGMRQERIFPDRQRISVFSQAKGYSVTLDPATKTYWKPQSKGGVRAYVESSATGVYGPQKPLGSESLNGRPVVHFRVTEGEDAGWEYWIDQKLHATVRMVKPGISTYEVTNIREGRQPASLFEVPADYKEVSPPADAAHSNETNN